MKNYLSVAAGNGMNMVMLPVFGLAEIRKCGDQYRFSFAKLGRFLKVCDEIGIRYLEVPHLFTAGDVGGAASIPYTEDGVTQNFEEMKSTDPEYLAFLRAFLKAFLSYMKKRGDDKRLYSHAEVVAAIEQELGCELTFAACAKSTEQMHRIRERVNEMIKARSGK